MKSEHPENTRDSGPYGNGIYGVMEADRFATLPPSAFVRLRALLEGRAAGGEPLDCTIGEPKHPFPDFVADVLDANLDGFGRCTVSDRL